MFKSFPSLKSFSTVTAIASIAAQAAAKSGVVDYTKDTVVDELLSEHEFSIISFYDSSKHAVAVENIFEGAKEFFDEQIESGEWGHRDVGWYRCDIEQFPELAPADNELIADQMMYVRSDGTFRYLHFDATKAEDSEA